MEVKLHDIGEGMSEGEVVQLLVTPGDVVTVDQPLLEVQTDKVTAELPAPIAGKIENILVSPGDVIEVGSIMLTITPTEQVQQEPTEQKGRKHQHHRILAAPFTRKIARENGVDIEKVTGTGPAGRVMDEDVINHMKTSVKKPEPIHQKKVERKEESPQLPSNTIPFRGRRKQIAAKMSKSRLTIPHVSHFDEVDVSNVLEIKALLEQRGTSISVAAFYIKAVCTALKEFPVFNSELDEEEGVIHLKPSINIGLAADTEEGLIVPVIHECDQLSVKEIHKEMKRLYEAASTNQLLPKEMSGSTFTISNAGPLGSTGATPIINYPEAALMAFHKTKRMPVVGEGDEIVIRSIMNLSMTFDHRIADGALSMRFTNRVMELIEQPALLLTELK
ncbi:dihydrolipoamide acetyltransferase family protein [Guptibacillus algicola]|uniref:dihydrolipoamide acetyltransferase family protein n=1 Tax=Guptibacillus algicola TaxID=225844 RepID=UPI001CD6F92B|nr:dihydrolipoamide acetyltransferase family protein [Alkalihalobacillus algicola]MCA0989134.1 2-oxo acid dehydrogenase subunit E2 [Alkalihalobacillus algicola]